MTVLSHIPPIDSLKVKLVCKCFNVWACPEFKSRDMTKGEVIQAQISLEVSLPRGRPLKQFICTHCGLVKPTDKFSDNQAVKTNYRRICISCGISHRTYTTGQMPKVNGVKCIPCWLCKNAVPEYENWRDVMALGKAALAKILDASWNEGLPQRYKTGDGRFLAWPYELQVLAFCKECLELMLRHTEEEWRLRCSCPSRWTRRMELEGNGV